MRPLDYIEINNYVCIIYIFLYIVNTKALLFKDILFRASEEFKV